MFLQRNVIMDDIDNSLDKIEFSPVYQKTNLQPVDVYCVQVLKREKTTDKKHNKLLV